MNSTTEQRNPGRPPARILQYNTGKSPTAFQVIQATISDTDANMLLVQEPPLPNGTPCWNMHSAPVSCVISPAYTVNSLVVSSICGIYYRYLCYLSRYLGLFLFLFVYKDIHYASCSHASVHTLVSICHTVSYKSHMRLAFLFTDFSALLPITVSLFYYAVQPLSLVFSHWHLALS